MVNYNSNPFLKLLTLRQPKSTGFWLRLKCSICSSPSTAVLSLRSVRLINEAILDLVTLVAVTGAILGFAHAHEPLLLNCPCVAYYNRGCVVEYCLSGNIFFFYKIIDEKKKSLLLSIFSIQIYKNEYIRKIKWKHKTKTKKRKKKQKKRYSVDKVL